MKARGFNEQSEDQHNVCVRMILNIYVEYKFKYNVNSRLQIGLYGGRLM